MPRCKVILQKNVPQFHLFDQARFVCLFNSRANVLQSSPVQYLLIPMSDTQYLCIRRTVEHADV